MDRTRLKWFSHATLVNLIIGPWYFLSLPKGVIIPTSLHGGAFLLLLVIGIALAILAVIFGLRRRVLPAVHLVLALLALMIVGKTHCGCRASRQPQIEFCLWILDVGGVNKLLGLFVLISCHLNLRLTRFGRLF